MINSVSKVANNNFFIANPDKKPRDYYLSLEIINNIKQNNEDKKRNLGLAIAIGAVATGLGVFVILNGGRKPSKLISKLQDFLQTQIEKTNNSKVGQTYAKYLKKVNTFAEKCTGINNFTSIKDIFVQKMMYKNKFTKKIHQAVAKFADSASYLTVKHSWNKSRKNFTKLFDVLDSVNEKILKSGSADEIITIGKESLTRKEWLGRLQQHATSIKSSFERQSGADCMAKRYDKIQEATKGLDDYIWKEYFSSISNLKNKKVWLNFLADDYIKGSKTEFANEMLALRNKISLTTKDKNSTALKLIKELEKSLPEGNKEGLSAFANLKYFLHTCEDSEKILEKIENLKEILIKSTSDKSEQDLIRTSLLEITRLIKGDDMGEIQKMLEIYKKLSPNEYKKLIKSMSKAVTSLDKSIETESIKYFDKIRDSKIGSAMTDIMSVACALGAVGIGLGKAKDKEEKISITFKYGVPAIGAISTALYCTTRLLPATKGLIFGTLSGLVFNRLGSKLDEMRIEKKKTLQTNQSVQPNTTNVV